MAGNDKTGPLGWNHKPQILIWINSLLCPYHTAMYHIPLTLQVSHPYNKILKINNTSIISISISSVSVAILLLYNGKTKFNVDF